MIRRKSSTKPRKTPSKPRKSIAAKKADLKKVKTTHISSSKSMLVPIEKRALASMKKEKELNFVKSSIVLNEKKEAERQEKLEARKKYAEGKSVYNPDNPNAMKIATVRATQVIPQYDQKKLSAEKLKQIRMIIVVDEIRGKILYAKLTSPKPAQVGKNKYLAIVNITKNEKYKNTVVDVELDFLDYSLGVLDYLDISKVHINTKMKLAPKDIKKIERALNLKLRNLQLSKKIKKAA